MTILLDSNMLIALVVADHVHHDWAEAWLDTRDDPRFATCPITEGTLVRLLVRGGQSATIAQSVVRALAADPRQEFWPDEITYSEVSLRGVHGHRQVTDAYLAELARRRSGSLATFDHGLASLHTDVVELVPTSDQ